jgi:hypothetical protein
MFYDYHTKWETLYNKYKSINRPIIRAMLVFITELLKT